MNRILILVLGLVAILGVACDALVTVDQPTDVPQAVLTAAPDMATAAPIMLREPTDTPATGTRSQTPTRAARATQATDGFPTIRVDQLPPEAQHTLTLIQQGGPFPYRQDGVVFENREGILPKKASGYYHEYTVVTPGASDRGARRIIAGQNDELYYTDDHYASFKRIVQ